MSQSFVTPSLSLAAGVRSRERWDTGRLAWPLRVSVAALLIPQLPTLLWLWQTHSAVYLRGWVNVEYLALLALALLYPSWGTIGLLTAEMCVALVEPFAHVYYFHPGDVLLSVRYVLWLPWPRLLAGAGLAVLYGVGCAAALRAMMGMRRSQGARQAVWALAGLCLLGAGMDMLHGRFNGARVLPPMGEVDLRPVRMIRAPAASIAAELYRGTGWMGRRPATAKAYVPLTSALGQAIGQLPEGASPDIVLVLTESWGLAADDRVNQAEMVPYRAAAVAAQYRVETGAVRFDGPTTSGETRELCGNSEGHASLAEKAAYFAGCWPERLDRTGYDTIAVHGFAPTMFRRNEWYGRFGFRESDFRPELERDGAAICDGAFPGACDADVARWIGNRLPKKETAAPMFVHWVTLNSHLPEPRLASLRTDECAAVGIAEDEPGLCTWFALVHRVHASVAELALKPGLRPTVFVIVGDHAPPFLRAEVRGRFSQTEVPYVVLIPRTLPERKTQAQWAMAQKAEPQIEVPIGPASGGARRSAAVSPSPR